MFNMVTQNSIALTQKHLKAEQSDVTERVRTNGKDSAEKGIRFPYHGIISLLSLTPP